MHACEATPIGERWIERPGASPEAVDPRDRAAAMLRQAQRVPPLGAAALGRIGARLAEAQETRRGSWAWVAWALVPAVAVLLVVMAPGRGGPGPVIATTEAPVQTTLLEGRLEVRAGARPARILLQGGEVTVAAGGHSEIEVHAFGGLRVAAYQGRAVVSWQGQVQDVSTGQTWTSIRGGFAFAPPPSPGEAGRASPPADAPAVQPAPVAPPAVHPDRPRHRVSAPLPAATGDADAPAPGPTALAAETAAIAHSLHALRQGHDPAAALGVLDGYQARFPQGVLRPEAEAARSEALLARGEQRAAAGQCVRAVEDFAAVLAAGADRALQGRALYGRASCRARLGDPAGARADLLAYLARFPSGPLSDAAREALGK